MQETRLDPSVGNMLWSRKWQSILICSPGKFHGQRSLVGYSSWGWTGPSTHAPKRNLLTKSLKFSSVWFSPSVVSDSLQPHESQHRRPPCPSPTPGVYSTHVHWVSDAIQPSHPLSSPSTPTLNLSQHQGLFKWVSSLHQVAKVLEFQLQH